jgi:hypothetical protein
MDVIPLDASLVKGSHGRVGTDAQPARYSSRARRSCCPNGPIAATAVKDAILTHVFGNNRAGRLRLATLNNSGAAPKLAGGRRRTAIFQADMSATTADMDKLTRREVR